jgi:hypothetical protein
MRRVITWQVVSRTLVISFMGLLGCRLVDQIFYGGKGAFGKTPAGSFVIILCAIAWCVGLLVLVPLRVAWDKSRIDEIQRKIRDGEIDPTPLPLPRQMAFFASFGNLPKWLYLPVVAVAWFLVGVLVLIIGGLALASITGKL